MIIDTSDLNNARKQIQALKKQNQEIIVKSQNEEFNRKILEIKGVNTLLMQNTNDKEELKQRNSGLNHVLCKIAEKNNVSIAIDLQDLKKQPAKQKAVYLSRIMQNIALCKKYNVKFLVFPANKFKKQDLIGLLLSLKSSTNLTKDL
jgi:RNase P/RNase MRP subunit p30